MKSDDYILPPRVATDRYRKKLHNEDLDRGTARYAESAVAGGLAGAAAKLRKLKAGNRALIGAGAGLVAEAGIRAVGRGTKDFYGERSRGAKQSEKLPAYAGLTTAAVLAYRRAGGRAGVTRGIRKAVTGFSALHLRPRTRAHLIEGAALAGGITVADVATHAAFPDKDESRKTAAKRGLMQGALYGTTLAGIEPQLVSKIRRIWHSDARVPTNLARRLQCTIEFAALHGVKSIGNSPLGLGLRKQRIGWAAGPSAGYIAPVVGKRPARGLPVEELRKFLKSNKLYAGKKVELSSRFKTAGKVAAVVGAGATVGAAAGLLRRPGRRVQPDENVSGELLWRRSSIPLIRHYGVGVDSGKVAHVQGKGSGQPTFRVDSFKKFTEDRPVFVERERSGPKKRIETIKKRIEKHNSNPGAYSVVSNNCETGANGVLHLRKKTNQVRDASIGAVAGGAATLATPGAVRGIRKALKFGRILSRPDGSVLVEFRRVDEQDLSKQRRHLALIGGGLVAGVGGLALLAKIGKGGRALAETAAATRKMPVGRGTDARRAAANAIRAERGHGYMKKMDVRERKRFDKLPLAEQKRSGELQAHTTNPNLSGEERRRARQVYGAFRGRTITDQFVKAPPKHNFSAFIKDVAVKHLPAETRRNIAQLIDVKPFTMLPHYGMTVKELVSKADPHNLKSARGHVGKMSNKAAATEVHARKHKKHILLLNDRIADGHHLLAKAERGGVTSSLNVVDLTPVRFQLERKLKQAICFMSAQGGSLPITIVAPRKTKADKVRQAVRTGAEGTGAVLGGAVLTAQATKLVNRNKAKIGVLKAAYKVGRMRGLIKGKFGFSRPIFFKRQQLREEGTDRFGNPLHAAATGADVYAYSPTGEKIHYGGDNPIPIAHAQVLRAAYNKAKTVHRIGGRAIATARDVGDVVQGKPRRVDYAGRQKKREWEKPYFRRAVESAAIGAGIVGGVVAARKFPKQAEKFVFAPARKLRAKANQAIPDFYASRGPNPSIRMLRANIVRIIEFDEWANVQGWDVRDPRGRSARVYAPGSRKRTRREKEWHETVEGQRKIRNALVAGALVTGAGAGVLVGRKVFPKIVRPPTRGSSALWSKAA